VSTGAWPRSGDEGLNAYLGWRTCNPYFFTVKPHLRSLGLLAASMVMLQPATQAAETTKAALQAFMRRQLASSLVGGQLIFIDFDTTRIRTVVPGKNHPDIFYNPKAGVYALCITAIDDKGKDVPVDVYVKDSNTKLSLVDVTFGDTARQGFMKFVKQGIFQRY
jgi:hypothetical protein